LWNNQYSAGGIGYTPGIAGEMGMLDKSQVSSNALNNWIRMVSKKKLLSRELD